MKEGRVETMTKEITELQKQELNILFENAYKAQKILETYSQERLDYLCRAVCWAITNKKTFKTLVEMGIEESGIGDPVSVKNTWAASSGNFTPGRILPSSSKSGSPSLQ